ncbi:hypothetical protein AMJ47_01570 [Parcubacteria bacterium DG_72]|nr:MAG: hypothetical protein AMJ47_01570 [Parcubacteria bacterium DG_72]
MKLKKITIITFTFSIFLLTANIINAGLGISPSRIIIEHLLRDSHYEKTFVLSRSEPKEDLNFRVLVEDSIKDWITIDQGTEFTMPAGQQRFPITIIVEPPPDTPNGSYGGNIRLISAPRAQEELGGSSAVTSLAAVIQSNFTVTGEQVLEYSILAINIKLVEEESPIGITLTINNTGNVKARPTKVHVDIYDKFKEIFLESYDITEMGFVDAFRKDDIIIEIPNKLSAEQYWAVVSVYRDNILLEEESVVFEIVEAGSLEKQGILKELLIDKEEFGLAEVVKITGLFENTGQVILSAKLVLEINKDDKLIDLIEGELVEIDVNGTKNLVAFFKPPEIGKYTIKGYAIYSGKTSSSKELRFKVKSSSLVASIGSGPIGAIGAIILLIIVGIGMFIKKRINPQTSQKSTKP